MMHIVTPAKHPAHIAIRVAAEQIAACRARPIVECIWCTLWIEALVEEIPRRQTARRLKVMTQVVLVPRRPLLSLAQLCVATIEVSNCDLPMGTFINQLHWVAYLLKMVTNGNIVTPSVDQDPDINVPAPAQRRTDTIYAWKLSRAARG
jgi:hypothetical protein